MQQTVESEIASGEEGQPGPGADAEPPEPASARIVSIQGENLGIDPDTIDWLGDRLGDAIAHVAERPATLHRVTVRIVDDQEMDDAHRRFSGIEGTTDVLTFVEDTDEGREVDLLICHDEACRRASELGHEVRRELLLYALHGVLHALGYDDHDPDDHARMHAEEDRILERIGVGRTYDRRGGG